MPIQPTIIETETIKIKTALTNLRPLFRDLEDTEILSIVLRTAHPQRPKGSQIRVTVKPPVPNQDHCNPKAVADFGKTKRIFTSRDAQRHFKVGPQKMAGSLAELRKKRIIQRQPELGKDGSTLWKYSGA